MLVNRLAGKEILILSLAFMFLFFGYDTAQQHLTTYYFSRNMVGLAYNSLSLIYISFGLFNLFAGYFISKFGTKRVMVISAIIYALYILCVPFAIEPLLLIFSVLLGISAALLWNAQITHLVNVSSEKEYGKNSGKFITLKNAGTVAGFVSAGVLVKSVGLDLMYVVLFGISVMSVALFVKLTRNYTTSISGHKSIVRVLHIFSNPRFMPLGLNSAFMGAVFGIAISAVPLEISRRFGAALVGILSLPFFLFMILMPYFIGRLSDKVGRERIIFLEYIVLLAGVESMMYGEANDLIWVMGLLLFYLVFTLYKSIEAAIIGDVSGKRLTEHFSCALSLYTWGGTAVILYLARKVSFEILIDYLMRASIPVFLMLLIALRNGLKNLKIKVK